MEEGEGPGCTLVLIFDSGQDKIDIRLWSDHLNDEVDGLRQVREKGKASSMILARPEIKANGGSRLTRSKNGGIGPRPVHGKDNA